VSAVTIVQARLNSRRLPGKCLLRVGDRTILQHVLHRLSLCDADLGPIVVATSTAPSDDALAAHCHRIGVDCYRGSLDNVLDRYHACALQYNADTIIRVTADCPLLCPQLLAQTIDGFDGADYATVTNAPTGLAQEMFSMRALERSWAEATSLRDREHVVTHMLHRRGLDARWLPAPHFLRVRDFWRLTVDHPTDLGLLRRLYDLTNRRLFDLDSRTIVAAVEADVGVFALATRAAA
jgi:spore coat polysaccharide biosynthesis protein SpsF (cytidylyltransferase family)